MYRIFVGGLSYHALLACHIMLSCLKNFLVPLSGTERMGRLSVINITEVKSTTSL